MPPLLQMQKLQGVVMEGGIMCLYIDRFSADQKIASSWKQMRLGACYSTSNKLLLVARHIMTTGLKKTLKLAK